MVIGNIFGQNRPKEADAGPSVGLSALCSTVENSWDYGFAGQIGYRKFELRGSYYPGITNMKGFGISFSRYFYPFNKDNNLGHRLSLRPSISINKYYRKDGFSLPYMEENMNRFLTDILMVGLNGGVDFTITDGKILFKKPFKVILFTDFGWEHNIMDSNHALRSSFGLRTQWKL